MATPCVGKGIRGFMKVYRFVLLLALSLMVSFNSFSEQLVKKSRMGSISLEEREEEISAISNKNFFRSYCKFEYPRNYYQPTIVETLQVKDEYGGYDRRIEEQRDWTTSVGAACFAGDLKACETGKAYFIKYANADAPKKKQNWSGRGRNKSSNQYVMNTHFLSTAINFFSIYHHKVGFKNEELRILDKWITKKVTEFRKNHAETKNNSTLKKHGVIVRHTAQNHFVVSADSSMALGAWLGKDSLFKIGLKQWDVTLRTMREDGSLPHETARGSRAIWYTGITLTKLIRIAELARVQGIDLYNLEVRGRTFHDAVSFMLDAVENQEIIHKYAKVNRDPGGFIPYTRQEVGSASSGKYAWIKPYLLRFPNHPNSLRIKNMDYNKNYFTKVFGEAVSTKYSNNNSLNLEQSCFYLSTENF